MPGRARRESQSAVGIPATILYYCGEAKAGLYHRENDTYLGINNTVLGTRDDDKAFNFGEVGEFGRVEFADTDGV